MCIKLTHYFSKQTFHPTIRGIKFWIAHYCTRPPLGTSESSHFHLFLPETDWSESQLKKKKVLFWLKNLFFAKNAISVIFMGAWHYKVYFYIYVCVLHTKFYVSSMILTSFRHGNFTSQLQKSNPYKAYRD